MSRTTGIASAVPTAPTTPPITSSDRVVLTPVTPLTARPTAPKTSRTPPTYATIQSRTRGDPGNRRQPSPGSLSGSELRQRSETSRYTSTKLANGMNHAPIAQPGPSRAPVRRSARALWALRHVHMTSSTTAAIPTKPAKELRPLD